jgi:hypothetical protein
MLEDDLQLLKSLFEAEGEGLNRQQIEELCAPLASLLVVMQLDTGILMTNYKQVRCFMRSLLAAGTLLDPTAMLGCLEACAT